MKFVLYLTIFQCIAQVLAVNHVLACLLFYVGVFSQEQKLKNWIDTYEVDKNEFSLQYMPSPRSDTALSDSSSPLLSSPLLSSYSSSLCRAPVKAVLQLGHCPATRTAMCRHE